MFRKIPKLVLAWFFVFPFALAFSQTSTPTILWPAPSAIPFLTPLSSVQLNAQVISAPPVTVPLDSFYNNIGITTYNYNFAKTGGYDYSGWAWSRDQFQINAAGVNTVMWQGVTFPLGPADAPDVVSNTTVALPAGSFGKLLMLGSIVNNALPATAHFIVNYTDGSSTAVDQDMSDWVRPRNYAGESLVYCAPTRFLFNGSIDYNSACVYGYEIALDPSRTVKNIVLPATPNAPDANSDRHPDVEILAMTLLPQAVPGTLAYTPSSGSVLNPGNQTLSVGFTPNAAGSGSATATVPLSVLAPDAAITPTLNWPTPAPITYKTPLSAVQLNAAAGTPVGPVLIPIGPVSRVNAFYPDKTLFQETGVDGKYNAFSATRLGTSLKFAGFTFPLVAPSIPDSATSSTIMLPSGQYSTLYLVGTGANGSQLAQRFTVTYMDGTTSVTPLDISSWDASQNFADETVVASTPYQVTFEAGIVNGTFDVYGYKLPVDPTKPVKSLTLPNNTNVIVLAAGLSPGTTFPIDGTYVYQPPSGTVLPIGTNPLAVAFSPADTKNFVSTNGTNSILVNAPVLTLTADNKSKVYGTPNPPLTGSLTGAVGGDQFTESFATTASLSSPAGSYAIVPSASPTIDYYKVVTVPGTLTISKAPVTGGLTSSASALLQRQTTTLTATVQTTTTGTPTGSVTFYQNGVTVGSAGLNNGVATLVPSLPFGSDVISAVYSGDNNFMPLTLAGPTITVSPLDFSLTAPQGDVFTGPIGTTPAIVLHVAPVHGIYAANVTYFILGELPPLAYNSFSPSMVAVDTGATDVTLAVHTRLLKGENVVPGARGRAPLYALLGMLFVVPLGALDRLRRLRVGVGYKALMLVLSLGVLAAASGCGSGYHFTKYPLTVVATDGTVTHTLNLTLQIQPPQ